MCVCVQLEVKSISKKTKTRKLKGYTVKNKKKLLPQNFSILFFICCKIKIKWMNSVCTIKHLQNFQNITNRKKRKKEKKKNTTPSSQSTRYTQFWTSMRCWYPCRALTILSSSVAKIYTRSFAATYHIVRKNLSLTRTYTKIKLVSTLFSLKPQICSKPVFFLSNKSHPPPPPPKPSFSLSQIHK